MDAPSYLKGYGAQHREDPGAAAATWFRNAGFGEVVFEYEPVAAAYEYRRGLDRDRLIFIADFGGGTSDFSLLRLSPKGTGEGGIGILGTDGVPIAGDVFDGQIVHNVVSPLLGMGTEYRSIFDRVLRVPVWIYVHLQRWHHLSFLKSPRTMQLLFDLRREALEPEGFEALIHIVQNDLGFHLYRAVEQTKVELSLASVSRFCFRHPPRGDRSRAEAGNQRKAGNREAGHPTLQ